MDGFIQLHRKLLQWEWYDDINTKVLFIHLLLKANYKPKNWRGIDIGTGEVLTGRITLSDETGLTQQQIRTCLNKLKSTNEITIKTTNKYSLIKLTNYNEYQQINQQTTQQVTNKQPTSNQQVTTTNKDNKEIKKINNKVLSSELVALKVATLETHIKESFTNEFMQEVKEKYDMTVENFKEESMAFLSYWKEKSPNGKKERRQKEKTFDPKLRFRTWMKNNKKWSKPNKYEDHENITSVFG